MAHSSIVFSQNNFIKISSKLVANRLPDLGFSCTIKTSSDINFNLRRDKALHSVEYTLAENFSQIDYIFA
jgi:hypothetical protein